MTPTIWMNQFGKKRRRGGKKDLVQDLVRQRKKVHFKIFTSKLRHLLVEKRTILSIWLSSQTTDTQRNMKIWAEWQTKYASAVPENLGLGLNFWPCSEGFFLSGPP